MKRALADLKGKLCKIYVNSLARPALEALLSELAGAMKRKVIMPIAFTAKVESVEDRGLWVTEARDHGNLSKVYFMPFDAVAFVNLIEKGVKKRRIEGEMI